MRVRGRRCAAWGAVLITWLSVVASAQAFEARGSVEQVWATGLTPGAKVTLLGAAGQVVRTQTAGSLGGVVFRDVAAGAGYQVSAGGQASDRLTVMSTRSAPLTESVYDQSIPSDGYGYMTMRDGTKLAYSVHPPTDVTNIFGVDLPRNPVGGPYPTLIEYAGYGYADPKGPQSGIAAIANIMGFAVVDVNMRGTGCSGGAFDFFEPLQGLDGYDVVETIARQPWVKGGKVGLFGISYGGISQLFTAATRPPRLAAIAPVSLIDATQTTLYPGGILNTGFALNWAKERVHDALPSGPDAGQAYAARQIAGGDTICKKNQELHPEAVDLLAKVRANNHYVPKVADPLAPVTFVDKINVPTFLACQFTDEQTGGHCPTMERQMKGNPKAWFTFTNGTHVDSLGPQTLNRLYDFLMIYVAGESPMLGSTVLHAVAPLLFAEAFGIDGLMLRDDPIQQQLTPAGARAAFEKLPRVRVLYDNGAGGRPGEPYPGFEKGYDRFPPAGVTARAWYLSAGGAMGAKSPARARAARFTWDARVRPPTNFSGDTGSGPNGLWTALPPYKWVQNPAANQAAFVSAPLTEDVTVAGAGAFSAWIRSSKPNVDLQATVTEVRPDGKETFVQSGWLRGNARKLDKAKSTSLAPVLSLRKTDVRGLPSKRFVKVTIPLYYQAHAYRKGSRIRVQLSAPNGDQPIWAFAEANPSATARVDVGAGGAMPSRLLLPVLAGTVPTALPPCPGLRGEPCRAYEPTANRVVRASTLG